MDLKAFHRKDIRDINKEVNLVLEDLKKFLMLILENDKVSVEIVGE